MGILIYFIKETVRGFLQAKLMTFVSIFTIAAALFFLGCVAVIFMNIHSWLERTSEDAGVVVYLEDESYSDSVACSDIVNKIKLMPQVNTVLFIGKDKAWSRFEKLYGTEMLDAVNDNPFPASIEITLLQKHQGAETIRSLVKNIEHLKGVEGVRYSREWLGALSRFRKIFLLCLFFTVPMIIIALNFMIANTIKLTIYARRDLITNMRLVGATDLFIKTPFVFEGVLQGMIGGIIGITGLSILKIILFHFSIYWGEWYFLPAVFTVGVIFGWIGSMSAVRRFLV